VQDIDSAHIIDGNVLDGPATGGPLHGGIWAKVALNVTDDYAGCKTDFVSVPQRLVACTAHYGPTLIPGASTIGFHIKVPDPASGAATLEWMVKPPGVADATEADCHTTIQAYPPYDKTVQSVPLPRLLSTDPQTYTFTQSVHLDQDAFGAPASIDYDWTYTITVQRA
jgi:hypothetical protein